MKTPYYFWTEQLTVGYEGKPLIREIAIEVRPGEILTLIGPNGAGKSTILKSLTRQMRALSGRIYIQGEDALAMSGRELARRQAVMLTERTTPELMTCREVVGLGRYPYTGALGLLRGEDERKVEEALLLVHCEALAERDFRTLSDGQRQMVLLARAICQEPELICLDEPTSFLDIRHKTELLLTLRRMARERGTAVILSLHELDLAQKISDRIVCVKGPAIESIGTPEEIFAGDHIQTLFEVEDGSYDEAFGTMELPGAKGVPAVFVIAGGGGALGAYRRLAREGVPFATGILWENDLDYHGAIHLASEVISIPAFYPVTEETLGRARERMLSCERVYCFVKSFGPYNEANRLLKEEAGQRGLLALDFPG